jgi:hypothetical protein
MTELATQFADLEACVAELDTKEARKLNLLEDYGLLMLLDRDTRRGPRTRVLAVITRRSAHCSLLRTHKPGSPLLLC